MQAPRRSGWQRLHHALMPDYNRKATVLWCGVVALGWAGLAWSLFTVAALPWLAWVQIAAGLLLTLGAGLFPVRIPGTKNSFIVGEIFIFLVLLMQGPAAAVVVAAAEAGMGTWRTSKRWTSRLFSPASATLAMGASGTLLEAALLRMHAAGWDGAAPLLAAVMVFSALYFFSNTSMVYGVPRLKRSEPFFQVRSLFSVFRWVGIAYAGSAAVATLLFVVYRQQGAGVLMVMVPLLVMLLVTLHLYFRQQEERESMRTASAGMAEREAAMAERETLLAARHLQELQASERRFHSAFTHAAIGMALLEFDGRLLQANPALLRLLGRDEQAVLQQPFEHFVHPQDRAALARQMSLADPHDFEGFALELRGQHSDGSTVWLALHCGFFNEADAARPCLILQAQDVSARRHAEAGLQHMAFHDGLTGLPNRRRFLECLTGVVARRKADRRHKWAVMFIDFDRFKLVNDSLGHTAGDELLLQLARRLQESLRPADVVARLGGDEFAILVNPIEQERDAIVLAERLLDSLRRPFALGDTELTASASIGITFSSVGYDSAEDALRDADTAMYKAKGAGKARYALFDASLHTAVSERLRLEGELRRAISRGELAVQYQPIFTLGAEPANSLNEGLDAMRLDGFEALVRWQHPQDGWLAPAAFLAIAEDSGQMLLLSDFVLHSACHQLRCWQRSNPAFAEITMSVNLSAHDLAHPGLVNRVSRAIVAAGLRPQHLTLELTENILMSHIEGALQTLHALRELGVCLAVDDFGTGYSSLSHLSKLPIDSLKIDRSFVRQLQPGNADSAVVSAIIQLGGSLHKAVVAEGIESAAQAAQLRALGCLHGQGFHLATPLTVPAADEWLRSLRGGPRLQ